MRREIEYQVKDPESIDFALAWARSMIEKGLQAGAVCVRLGRPRRNKDQNAKLWPMLTDVSRQKQLVINGVPTWAKPEDWKDVFTAALKREQRVANGIDGGVVFLGQRTSRMDKQTFSELIELIYQYGAEHEIEWSEPAKQTIHQYRETV